MVGIEDGGRGGPSPVSVVVRYGEHLAPRSGTIAAHNSVLDRLGYVWFGKMGSPLAHARINCLAEQITHGLPTYVVLVGGKQSKGTCHICTLSRLTRSREVIDIEGVPEYYRSLDTLVGTWLRITSIDSVDNRLVGDIFLIDTGTRLRDALARSMSGHFYVQGLDLDRMQLSPV